MSGAREVSDDRKPGSILTGLRIIFETTPVAFVVLLVVSALRGLAPAFAAILAGRAVDAIPDGNVAFYAVAVAVVYGANQVVGALTFPFEEGWAIRLWGRTEQRALRAMTAPPLVDHLLDPEVRRTADIAVKQDWPHIGPFATGFLYATQWFVGGLAQAVVLAQFSVPLAIGATALWCGSGAWMRKQDLMGIWVAYVGQRFPQYLRWFTMQNETAAEMRLFGNAPWFIDRFDHFTRESYAAAWKQRATTARVLGPLLVVLVLGNLAGIAFIAHAAYAGDITVAELAVYATVFVGLSDLALPQEWTEWVLWGATRLPAIEQLEAIAARESARVQPASPKPMPVLGPTIRFDAVSFAYPGRAEPIIRDLDLTIDSGSSLAIVGDNGAGKTTLVRLIARLHDPTIGHLSVDGTPLPELDPTEWQRGIAAVFQDSIRYPFTIAETIALNRSFDRDLLAVAANAVGSSTVIDELPRGWDTVMSRKLKDGIDLSGGQWQRVALTRAAYALGQGARLLMLDEPTANLDVRGEAELYDRFVDLARGATTVLVSHRFSTVRRADRIVVLDHGRIVEDGSHADLMRHAGRYATLFRLQADRYREEVNS